MSSRHAISHSLVLSLLFLLSLSLSLSLSLTMSTRTHTHIVNWWTPFSLSFTRKNWFSYIGTITLQYCFTVGIPTWQRVHLVSFLLWWITVFTPSCIFITASWPVTANPSGCHPWSSQRHKFPRWWWASALRLWVPTSRCAKAKNRVIYVTKTTQLRLSCTEVTCSYSLNSS